MAAQAPPDVFRRDSNILRNSDAVATAAAANAAAHRATSEMAQLDLDHIAARTAIFDAAFADYPVSVGKAVSKKEREELNKQESTLVYGEINYEAFALSLEKVRLKYGRPGAYYSPPNGVMQEERGGIFYDLGSGTGKPVIAAATLHHWERCTGIEYLEGLHVTANEAKATWEGEHRNALPAAYQEQPTEIHLVHGDCTDFDVWDWSDGDVLFANSTCFDQQLMEAIAACSAHLRRGAIFITLTRRLPSDHFEVLEQELHQMSWGNATVYIQQKTTPSVRELAEPSTESASAEPVEGADPAAAAAAGVESIELNS